MKFAGAMWGRSISSVSGRRLVGAALIVRLVVGGGALAQQASSSVNEAPTDESGGTLETVVITAERREADIQKTAMSVTAISGNAIGKEGVTNLNDVLETVSNVEVNGIGTQGVGVAIRGIGTDGVNKAAATAIYEDGVTVATGLDGYYFDLARVEVLAGPQGTLYGGTATGGAINVITNSPKLNTFEASAQGEYGNYSLYHGTGIVNIPVSSTLALRLGVNWQQRDSYASKDVLGLDQLFLRARALWEPNDSLSLLAGAEYFHDTSLGADLENVDYGTGTPSGPGVRPIGTNEVKVQKYYLNAKADLGFGELTYIPAVQLRDIQNLSLGGFLGMQNNTPYGRYITQELRLASKPNSKITWVGGLYYFDEAYTTTGNSGPGTGPFIPFITVIDAVDNHQGAVFGQVTYPLLDTLRITGGGRYSQDVVHHPQTSNGVLTPFLGRYHSLDYLARLEYDVTSTNLLYGSLSTGYRPGGIAEAPNSYGDEKIKAYEIGSKNSFLDRSLVVNGDVFYYRYSGFQTGLTVPCTPGPGACFVFDVASIPAELKGAELTFTWAPTRADTMSLSPTYIESRYTGPASVPQYVGGPVTALATDGHAVTHTAKWAANASYEHAVVLRNDQSVSGRIEANYRGNSFTNFDPCIFSLSACSGAALPIDWEQKQYTLFNASLQYSGADRSWDVGGYIRNLTDRVYKVSFGPSQATVGAPRTYGVTVSKRW